jgi:hypothetical protein
MPATPAREELTITLPKDLADLVRAQVAAHSYESPVDYLSHVVHIDIAESVLPPIEEEELENWLKAEVPRLCAEADAHPELMLTAEDMYQAIDDEIEAIRREQ